MVRPMSHLSSRLLRFPPLRCKGYGIWNQVRSHIFVGRCRRKQPPPKSLTDIPSYITGTLFACDLVLHCAIYCCYMVAREGNTMISNVLRVCIFVSRIDTGTIMQAESGAPWIFLLQVPAVVPPLIKPPQRAKKKYEHKHSV